MRRALAGLVMPLLLLGCNAASTAASGIVIPFPAPGASAPTGAAANPYNCVSPTLAPGTWWESSGSLHVTIVDWQGHPQPVATFAIAQEPRVGMPCSLGIPFTTDASGAVTIDRLIAGQDRIVFPKGGEQTVTVVANQTTDVTVRQSMPSPEPSFAVSPSPVEPSERTP